MMRGRRPRTTSSLSRMSSLSQSPPPPKGGDGEREGDGREVGGGGGGEGRGTGGGAKGRRQRRGMGEEAVAVPVSSPRVPLLRLLRVQVLQRLGIRLGIRLRLRGEEQGQEEEEKEQESDRNGVGRERFRGVDPHRSDRDRGRRLGSGDDDRVRGPSGRLGPDELRSGRRSADVRRQRHGR